MLLIRLLLLLPLIWLSVLLVPSLILILLIVPIITIKTVILMWGKQWVMEKVLTSWWGELCSALVCIWGYQLMLTCCSTTASAFFISISFFLSLSSSKAIWVGFISKFSHSNNAPFMNLSWRVPLNIGNSFMPFGSNLWKKDYFQYLSGCAVVSSNQILSETRNWPSWLSQ